MRNKKILGIAALAAVAAVGGSFAYFNQTMTAENPFNTGKYETTMVEDFNPKDGENWEPGAKVTKEVKVENLGNQPVVVRVRLDETWSRGEGADKKDFKIINGKDKAATESDAQKIIKVNQENPTDGLCEKDDTVVGKELNLKGADGKDLWIYGGDGWYYYADVLPGVTEENQTVTTEAFLKSVTLAKDLDLGVEERSYTYNVTRTNSTKPEGKEDTGDVPKSCMKDGEVDLEALAAELGIKKGDTLTTKVKAGTKAGTGYSSADYVLTITSQTVQATKDAVTDVFKVNETTPWTQPGGLNWSFMTQN